MNNIDSQSLMAYADGELDAIERQQVERALAESPELQQQLQQICQLDTLLGAAFNDAMQGQQPPLRALDPIGHASGPGLQVWQGLKLWQGLSERFSWQASAAAAALLVVGVAIGGWFERQSLQAEFAVNQQQLEQAIDKALETRLSGESLQWSGAKAKRVGSITPVRTYKSDQGQYCREFIQRQSEAGQINELRGVACRGEQGWKLKANYYL
ncbi:MAG: RT0821/Lpp0805 family surface protein [Motiliproteus sp.]